MKNHFIFYPVQKQETDRNFTGSQISHFMIVLILYMNLSNLSWNKKQKKMSIFGEYGAFKFYFPVNTV